MFSTPAHFFYLFCFSVPILTLSIVVVVVVDVVVDKFWMAGSMVFV